MYWFAQESLILTGWSVQRYFVFAGVATLAMAVTTVALLGMSVRAGGMRSRTTFAVIGLGVFSALAVGGIAWMWAITALLITLAGVLALRALRGVGARSADAVRAAHRGVAPRSGKPVRS